MKKTLLTTLSLFLFSVAFCQTAHITHTKIENINFKNDTQKKLFTQEVMTYDQALTEALAAGDISSKVEQERLIRSLEKFAINVIRPMYRTRKHTKSLIKIQQKINAKYFKVYSDAALINDALFTGEFNCVTNAIINAYILEKAGVTFTIEGDGTCYYLKPTSGNPEPIFGVDGLEQTPIAGNKTFYNDYTEMMLGLQVITNEEYLTSTPRSIYEEYNDEPEYMDAKALLAIYHILIADYKTTLKEYEEAYNHSKMANFLYPSYSTQTFTLLYGAAAIDNQESYTLAGLDMLSELHNFNNRYIPHHVFVSQGIRMYNELDKETFRTAYSQLINLQLQDSTIREIDWYVADHTALYFYNNALLDSAYIYAKVAYNNSPQDLENQNLFYNRFIGTYTRKSISNLENEALLLFSAYPEFMSNPYFRTLRQNLILIEASNKIDKNNYSEAESLIERFEKLEKEDNGDLKPEAVNIVKSYGRLAIFYFSTNNEKKALKMLEKALSIYPENRDLLRKQSMIQSY